MVNTISTRLLEGLMNEDLASSEEKGQRNNAAQRISAKMSSNAGRTGQTRREPSRNERPEIDGNCKRAKEMH